MPLLPLHESYSLRAGCHSDLASSNCLLIALTSATRCSDPRVGLHSDLSCSRYAEMLLHRRSRHTMLTTTQPVLDPLLTSSTDFPSSSYASALLFSAPSAPHLFSAESRRAIPLRSLSLTSLGSLLLRHTEMPPVTTMLTTTPASLGSQQYCIPYSKRQSSSFATADGTPS